MVSKRYVVNSLKYQHTQCASLPAAEAGHAAGQNNLGWMFEYGLGVEANQVKAIEWYQKGVLSPIL
jgi:Sel1 repeat